MSKRIYCALLALFLIFYPTVSVSAAPAQPAPTLADAAMQPVQIQAVPNPLPANAACQKLQTGQPIRVAILGDSIAAGAGTIPEYAWSSLLKPWLELTYGSCVTLDNFAIGGTGSYVGYYQAENAMRNAIAKSGSYDLVVICYGHNDAAEHFPLIYESLLRSVKKQNADCQLITVLESSQQTYTEKMRTVIDLSTLYGADIADTIGSFALSGLTCEQLCSDGIHPNTDGHRIYFETIGSVLAECVQANRPVVPLPQPSSQNVLLLDNSSFVPLSSCRKSNGQYQLTVTRPVLGIVYRQAPNHGEICLDFGHGARWHGTASTSIDTEWNNAALTNLSLTPGTVVTLQNPDGKIADTVLGFLTSGPAPTQESKLKQQVTDILRSITTPEMTPDEKLMAAANYVIDNCSYKRIYGNPSGANWPAAYAQEMLTNGKGNCYCYASAIAYLAEGLGFDARVCAGSVRSSQGGQTPHGWAEVFLGDDWYIFDGSMQDANKAGFFHITYQNYPSRRKPLIAEQVVDISF